MNAGSWLLWGFVATLTLTTLMVAGQGMRLTRMNIPYLLGTMVTPDRDRALLLGVGIHVLNGWLFSLLYVAIFQAWSLATWWLGMLLGLLHAAFVLIVLMPLLPSVHPRMASEHQGPTVVRQLEPPGFLGLHYGVRTPISVVIAHAVFGAILGAWYRVV